MQPYPEKVCVECGKELMNSENILSLSKCPTEKSGYRCADCFTEFTLRRVQRLAQWEKEYQKEKEKEQRRKEGVKRAIITYHRRQEQPKQEKITKKTDTIQPTLF